MTERSSPTSRSSPVTDVARPSTATDHQEIDSTLKTLDRLLDHYRRIGDREGEAKALCAIARCHKALRQQQKAMEEYKAALGIWRELGNKDREATTLNQIGEVYRTWGFPQLSIHFYRDAIKIFRLTTDREAEAAATNNLGVAYFALHDGKKCLENLNQSLKSFRAQHDRQGESRTLTNLGATYGFLFNDPHKALDFYQEAVTELELINDRSTEANALEVMGDVWLKLGKPEMAALSFQHAIFLYHKEGDAGGEEAVRKHSNALSNELSLAARKPRTGSWSMMPSLEPLK